MQDHTCLPSCGSVLPIPAPAQELVWRGKHAPLHGLQRWVRVLLHPQMWPQLGLHSHRGCSWPSNTPIRCDTSQSKEKLKMEKSKVISFRAFPLKILSKTKTRFCELSIFYKLTLSIDCFAISVTQSSPQRSKPSFVSPTH